MGLEVAFNAEFKNNVHLQAEIILTWFSRFQILDLLAEEQAASIYWPVLTEKCHFLRFEQRWIMPMRTLVELLDTVRLSLSEATFSYFTCFDFC